MSKYSLEKEISSCNCGKDLVAELERLVLNKAMEINGIDQAEAEKDLTVSMHDAFGTETLPSINAFSRDRFSNDIRGLTVQYDSYQQSLRRLKVAFGASDYSSKATIDINCNSARERAVGILGELNRLIGDHGNLNFLFYRKFSFIPFVLGGFCVYSILQIGNNLFEFHEKISLLFYAISCFLLIVLWLLLKLANPYVVFDTTRNHRNQEIIGWIIKGAGAAVIFGGIAKWIFGG